MVGRQIVFTCVFANSITIITFIREELLRRVCMDEDATC